VVILVSFGHAAVIMSSIGFVIFGIVTCGNGFVIILAVVIDVIIGASVIVMFVVVVVVAVCSGTIMCHKVVASCYGHRFDMIFISTAGGCVVVDIAVIMSVVVNMAVVVIAVSVGSVIVFIVFVPSSGSG